MPTPEERLTTLEKTVALLQKSSSTSTQELSRNVTMLLGIISSQQLDIKEIKISQVTVEERLDIMDRRMESGFEIMEKRLGAMENRFGTVEKRQGTLEGGFETLNKKFDLMLDLLTTLTDQRDQKQ